MICTEPLLPVEPSLWLGPIATSADHGHADASSLVSPFFRPPLLVQLVDYALLLVVIAGFATLLGQYLMDKAVEVLGRPSLVIFSESLCMEY